MGEKEAKKRWHHVLNLPLLQPTHGKGDATPRAAQLRKAATETWGGLPQKPLRDLQRGLQ